MTKNTSFWTVLSLLAAGCATGPPERASLRSAGNGTVMANAKTIKQVDYQELVPPKLNQRSTLSDSSQSLIDSQVPPRHSPANGMSMESLEQMALSNNPAIAQSEARVLALRCKLVHVGLPPNPTAGYTASEIGNDGAAGQHGAFFGQDFITAKKLQRNRAIVSAEISQAAQ